MRDATDAGRAAVLMRALRTFLGSLALACFRAPLVTLVVLVLAAGVATYETTRLKLDPDVTQLLPPTYETVREVERLRERFGGVGYVVLLVEGGTPASRRLYADDVSKELEKLATIRYVDHAIPVDFFEKRALYFVDQGDLEHIRDQLRARQKWEIERSIIDIDDATPPPLDFSVIEQKYQARIAEIKGGAGAERNTAYYEDDTKTKLAIFAQPTQLASNLDFSKRVVAEVEGVLERVPAGGYDPGMRVELTGRYKKRVDLQTMLGEDLRFTSILALALVILYLALHFRRPLAVVLILAPLYLGVMLSYGVAGALFGTLNILTSFIGAILVGIGIDNGLHMLGRYEEGKSAGASSEEAVRTAFGEAGRISFAAALTIASAFAALTWTDFRAFREFGVLAASGMVLVLLAYLTLLPALLGAVERWLPSLARPVTAVHLPGVRPMHRHAAAIFWVGVVAIFLVILHAGEVRFDADFSRLDDADLPSFHLDKEVNRLLGRSQTPMVVLADSEDEAREVAQVVRDRMRALGPDATIGLIATRADLLPSNQEEKAPVLKEIAKILARVERSKLDDELRDQATKLDSMARAAPFGAADLPPSLRHVFEPKPGSGSVDFVLLYPTVSMGEASAVLRLSEQLRRIELSNGTVKTGAGEAMVLADILYTVRRDAPRILLLTLGLVFSILILALGKVRLALLALAPAAVTLIGTVGVVALLGIDINYLNMIMFPILLGIGVDDSAHIVARVEAGEPVDLVWRRTGLDVLGAILTDVFGFGALAAAAHPGLASLGLLALVGLGLNLVTSIVVLPAALTIFSMAGRARPRSSIWEKIVTVGYAGRTPVAPGTVGAIAAIPLAWGIHQIDPWLRAPVCGALVVASVVATNAYLRERSAQNLPSKDPQNVVIDETVGCLVAMSIVPFEAPWAFTVLGLFRLLDITKPWPIRWLERRLPGGLGVVMDDVGAGLIAGGGLHVAHRVLGG